MTELNGGDRVKVKIDVEGVITCINGNGTYDVRLDGDNRAVEYIAPRYVAKLPAIGDVISAGLPDLPNGSVVLELDHEGNAYPGTASAVWTRHGDGEWRAGANTTGHEVGDYADEPDITFRILHVAPK